MGESMLKCLAVCAWKFHGHRRSLRASQVLYVERESTITSWDLFSSHKDLSPVQILSQFVRYFSHPFYVTRHVCDRCGGGKFASIDLSIPIIMKGFATKLTTASRAKL